MSLALLKPRIRVPATMKAGPVCLSNAAAAAPAGARLLEYLGMGAQVALIPGGMMLAVQAEHLRETFTLADFGFGSLVEE